MKNFINFLLFMYLSSSIITIIVYLFFLLFGKSMDAKFKYNILKINLIYYFIPSIIYFVFKFTFLRNNITYCIDTPYFSSISREINNSTFIRNVIVIVWLFGCLIFVLHNLFAYIKFRKIINKYSMPILDGYIYDEYTALIKSMKIKSKIKLMKNSIIKTPMVVGNYNLLLIIPYNMESEKAIRAVLMHELTHINRKDLLLKKFQFIIKCIYWYNPLVFMLDALLDDWCEISCDENIVKYLDYNERKDYGYAILSIVKNSQFKKAKFARTLCSEKSYIKTRLLSVMEYDSNKYRGKLKSILALLFVFSICLFSSFIIERTSLFSPKYYVINNGSIYSKEFDGGVIEFNKDTGDVKVIIDKDEVDEDAYKEILSDLLNEGEIK